MRKETCMSIQENSMAMKYDIPIESAGVFILAPFITHGNLPLSISIKEFEKTYPESFIPSIEILRATGWYSMNAAETDLVLTSNAVEAQLFTGQIFWLSASMGAMHGGSRDMCGVIRGSSIIGEYSTYGPYLVEIEKVLNNGGISRLVEIGQGNGAIISRLLAMHPQLTGVAIDSDPAAAEATRQMAQKYSVNEQLKIITHDINDDIPKELLTGPGHTLVIGAFVFHELKNLLKGIQLISEDLKDGDQLIIAELVKDHICATQFSICMHAYHNFAGTNIPSIDEWENIFRQAGLAVESVKNDGMMPGSALFHLRKNLTAPRIIPLACKAFSGHNTDVAIINLVGVVSPRQVISEVAFVDMSVYPNGISGKHKHDDQDEVYVFPSRCVVEVYIDGETKVIQCPAGVFIPAGVEHFWRPYNVKKGDYVLGIFTGKEEATR